MTRIAGYELIGSPCCRTIYAKHDSHQSTLDLVPFGQMAKENTQQCLMIAVSQSVNAGRTSY